MEPSERAGNSHLSLPQLSGRRILAVDDDPDALMLLRALLEMTGALVETATSAAAALEILDARTPNVLVSDLSMPQMSGLDLIDRIRASNRADVRALPAIALTASTTAEDRVQALDHGFQAYLAKPVELIELVTVVNSLTH